MNSRRDFLKQMSGAALVASVVPSTFDWATPQAGGQTIDMPGEDGMIVRSFRFVDLETPVEYFNSWLTPVPHFCREAGYAKSCRDLQDRNARRGQHT